MLGFYLETSHDPSFQIRIYSKFMTIFPSHSMPLE